MKIAIVGTSKVKENTPQEITVKLAIQNILSKYIPAFDWIISGGAAGVDTFAEEMARINKFSVIEYRAKYESWEWYKIRNMQIAKECDILYCITTKEYTEKCYHHDPPQEHQKTAGCYTLKIAKFYENKTELILV